MTGVTDKAKEISFIQNAGNVTVRVNGVSVEIHADGSILAYTNGNAKVCPPANDADEATAPAAPKIGAKMPDGTIYAGVSPDTDKAMYATPADASLTMTFNEAKEYATRLDAHGHEDWHVPTKSELNVLFNNRAAIGGFNESASSSSGWHWSSASGNNYLWYLAVRQRFSDGHEDFDFKLRHSASAMGPSFSPAPPFGHPCGASADARLELNHSSILTMRKKGTKS